MPNLSMNFDNMNISAQVGDIVYYSHSGSLMGGFDNTALPNTRMLGPILSIVDNTLSGGVGWTLVVDHNSNAPAPAVDAYISFAKNKRVNTSSLLGYYASINFVNNSTNKVELFAVGSETSVSSK